MVSRWGFVTDQMTHQDSWCQDQCRESASSLAAQTRRYSASDIWQEGEASESKFNRSFAVLAVASDQNVA